MRSPTKATIGVVTLGILAGSYQLGVARESTQTSLAAAGNSNPNATPSTDPGNGSNATPTTSANSSTSTGAGTTTSASGSNGSGSTTTGSGNSTTSSSSGSSNSSNSTTNSGSSNSTSSSSSSGSSGSNNTATASATHTGAAIAYRYGTIQLEVVKSGSKITAINLIQASTHGQQYAQVPPMLVDAAISANGSGFGNVSGATFTTEAFRSALESALAQF